MSTKRIRRTRHRAAPRTLTAPAPLAAQAVAAVTAIAPTAAEAVEEPILAADEIQGNILPGFGTLSMGLLGLRITRDADSEAHARRWLRELAPLVTTLAQMHQQREVRRAVAKATRVRPAAPNVFLNVALSPSALPPLGLVLPASSAVASFLKGMNGHDLQDEKDLHGVPVGWVMGATPETTPDIFLILGCDDAAALDHALNTLAAHTGAGTGLSVIYRDTGHRLPDDREHFGFRDGLSQPGVRGRLSEHPEDFLTRRLLSPTDPLASRFSRPGEPLIWPGQFLFGYPVHLDDDSPGAEARPPVEWMRNGSILVFRRLQQDVAAFRNFAQSQAQPLGQQLGKPVTAEDVQAWIVGRWPDGQPLSRFPAAPVPGAPVPDHMELNHFDYGFDTPDVATLEGRVISGVVNDDAGLRCPHFAHIRKVNLRDKLTDQGPSHRFRILRRGIPYGSPWQPGETEAPDRGLLFLSYQKDIEAFLTLSTNWMNSPNAPEGHGHDLLLGQSQNGRAAVLFRPACPAAQIQASLAQRWIRATGGGFFFSPSVSVLKRLNARVSLLTTKRGVKYRSGEVIRHEAAGIVADPTAASE